MNNIIDLNINLSMKRDKQEIFKELIIKYLVEEIAKEREAN